MGIDFCPDKIRGIGCVYGHHFLTDKKNNHWFSEINCRYVKYASGYAANAPFDYFDPSATCNDDLNTEHSILSGSLSVGREFFLSKIFHFNISIGGGAYWWKKETLECLKPIYGDDSEEAIHPEAVLKVGIGINVYRKVKQ